MLWVSETATIMDIMVAVGSMATVITVLLAAIALRQTSQARNLASIIDVAQQLNAERQRAFEAGLYEGMDKVSFHVFQMTNLVEHASFLINKGIVSSDARIFLLEWLKSEIAQMDSQPAYVSEFEKMGEEELTELRALRERFRKERASEEHFKRVAYGFKRSTINRLSTQNSDRNGVTKMSISD